MNQKISLFAVTISLAFSPAVLAQSRSGSPNTLLDYGLNTEGRCVEYSAPQGSVEYSGKTVDYRLCEAPIDGKVPVRSLLTEAGVCQQQTLYKTVDYALVWGPKKNVDRKYCRIPEGPEMGNRRYQLRDRGTCYEMAHYYSLDGAIVFPYDPNQPTSARNCDYLRTATVVRPGNPSTPRNNKIPNENRTRENGNRN
jgi:hypothetical protein